MVWACTTANGTGFLVSIDGRKPEAGEPTGNPGRHRENIHTSSTWTVPRSQDRKQVPWTLGAFYVHEKNTGSARTYSVFSLFESNPGVFTSIVLFVGAQHSHSGAEYNYLAEK